MLQDNRAGDLEFEPVDRRLAKRLKHECFLCRDPALPDSDFCGPHRDSERARVRLAQAERRKTRRRKRVCVDCGLKSKTVRCSSCAKAQSRKRDVVTTPKNVVTTKGFTKLETGTHAWGSGSYQTQRYVGHARRGRLTLQEQTMEDKRDAGLARADLLKFEKWLDGYADLPLADMPRIQRQAKRREALIYLGNARRFIEELEEKFGGG